MKICLFVTSFFLFICNGYGFQLTIDHPHFVPEFTGGLITVGAGAGHREIEYESNKELVDEQQYKLNEARLKALISPWKNFALGIIGHYDFDREYELKFGPASTRAGDPPYQSSAQGPLDPEIFFIYEFNSRKDNWNQQVYLSGNPFDIKEEPRKIYRGGNDIFLEYRFSHKYDIGALYGNLFSHYFGRKSFYQPGDPRPSLSEAYTEVGLNLGFLFSIHSRWSLFIDGTFGLSSDYIVKTPEVARYADKGYLIFVNAGANYLWNKNLFITFKTWRGSRIYNATQESLNRDIDYEIEDNFYLISFNFAWDKVL
jgi:hypothetical protein